MTVVNELKQWQKDLLTVAVYESQDTSSKPVIVVAPDRMGKSSQASLRRRAAAIESEHCK